MRALRRATTERPPPRPLCLSQQDSLYLPRVRLAGKQKSQNSGEMAALVGQIRGGPHPFSGALPRKPQGLFPFRLLFPDGRKAVSFKQSWAFCRRACDSVAAGIVSVCAPITCQAALLTFACFLPFSCRNLAGVLRGFDQFRAFFGIIALACTVARTAWRIICVRRAPARPRRWHANPDGRPPQSAVLIDRKSGARGEIRTRTPAKAEDFESPASTVPPLGPPSAGFSRPSRRRQSPLARPMSARCPPLTARAGHGQWAAKPEPEDVSQTL